MFELLDNEGYALLVCPMRKKHARWFFSAIGLTTFALCDTIPLWCKWCGHIHSFSYEPENDDILCETE